MSIRRRRMLNDEMLDEETSGEEIVRPARPARPAASEVPGRRVHDLVPTGRVAIAAVLVLLALPIVAIEGLHDWHWWFENKLGPEAASPLNLTAPRNLSHWLGSVLLGTGALTAVLVFSLRQHRADDYHGRYRVWVWMALAAVIGSVHEATNVSVLVGTACERLAERCSLSGFFGWPFIPGVLIVGLAIRLVFEIRRSRLAISALSIAAIAIIVGECYDWLNLTSEAMQPRIVRGSLLAGYAALLVSFLLYARHVVFELEGRIAIVPPKRKPKKQKKSKSVEAEAEPAKPAKSRYDDSDSDADADEVEASPRLRIDSTSKGASAPASHGASGLSEHVMSRAERRRQRREAKRAA